jgi:hypothetical protein
MATHQTKVIIVGEDPVVGRALETLLRSAGYRARFLSNPAADAFGELLADSHLLLVAPPVSAERRRVLRARMRGRPTATGVAVLELVPTNGGEQLVQREGVVLWPCSAEELKRGINSALRARE